MSCSGGGSQQYCLRWNNYQNNLTNVFDQLLQSEAFVDVTLACDGESLKCHKMILSACSPFFQNLFFENPCTHPIVILKDMRWEELKAVVEFMYRGEINVSQEQLTPLLKVAAALKIRGLADVSQRSGLVGTLNQKSQDNGESSGKGKEAQRPPSKTVEENATGEADPLGSLVSQYVTTASSKRKRMRISSPDKTPSSDEEERSRDPNDFLSTNGGDSDIDHSSSSFLTHGLDSPNSNTLGDSAGPSSFVTSAMNSSACSNILGAGASGSTSNNASTGVSMGHMNLHNSMQIASSSSTPSSIPNEMDLKPGIVEMIREEERAKMLESSFAWGGPSTSSLSDSYQYQLQSLWQKCWNNNQGGVVQTLRFRERGPLKSWRPETMAEAIFAVLREGLSLSQAARKYDIPYPTFVLYANRVHNMLGPSADGCAGSDLISDMRPKGRGRPQRILLGSWPEDHVRGVIRAVVFRDPGGKDEPAGFNRDSSYCPPSHTSTATSNGVDMSLRTSPPGTTNFSHMHPSMVQQQRLESSSVSNCFESPGAPGSSAELIDPKGVRPFNSSSLQVSLRTRDDGNTDSIVKNSMGVKPDMRLSISKCNTSVTDFGIVSTGNRDQCSLITSKIPEEIHVKAEISYDCMDEEDSAVFGGDEQQHIPKQGITNLIEDASQINEDLDKNLSKPSKDESASIRIVDAQDIISHNDDDDNSSNGHFTGR